MDRELSQFSLQSLRPTINARTITFERSPHTSSAAAASSGAFVTRTTHASAGQPEAPCGEAAASSATLRLRYVVTVTAEVAVEVRSGLDLREAVS